LKLHFDCFLLGLKNPFYAAFPHYESRKVDKAGGINFMSTGLILTTNSLINSSDDPFTIGHI